VETSEVDLSKEKKPTKEYVIKWRSKINKLLKVVNVAVEIKLKEKFTNEEISMISEEWEDIMSDLLKKGPFIVKLAVTVITTGAIVAGFIFRVKRRIHANKGETGPPQDNQ
jgi:hypothetical protein